MLIVIVNPVSNPAASAVDNDIRLVFSSQPFGLIDGRTLFSVLAGYPLVPFATYGPAFFIGHHMLVPGSAAFVALRAIQKDFNEIYKGS